MANTELTNVLTKLRSLARREAQRATIAADESEFDDEFTDMHYHQGQHDGYASVSRWLQLILENDEKFIKLLDSQDDSK